MKFCKDCIDYRPRLFGKAKCGRVTKDYIDVVKGERVQEVAGSLCEDERTRWGECGSLAVFFKPKNPT